jgi:hypothetical protein
LRTWAQIYQGSRQPQALAIEEGAMATVITKKRQFNKITAANAGWCSQFRIRGSRHRPGVAEFRR